VLALPSLVEPLGIVALEALASGRPVAATREGGTAEVVGRAGALVNPLDPRSIASGVLRLLRDPPPERVCRETAAAHSVDRQAARVQEILAAAAG
jgi:glycosyltransferase involved in cell wall biosynthesis